MGKIYRLLLIVTIFFWIPLLSLAQGSSAKKPKKAAEAGYSPGPTAFVQVVGKGSSIGTIYNGGIGVGYNFSKHFGGDIGFTLYTVQSPYSVVTNHDWRWTTLAGDPFLDFRYKTEKKGIDLTSVLTGSFPLSSSRRVFTTGRVGVDWFNNVTKNFKGFAPFLNFGAGNETVDRYVLPRPYNIARPYQSFGFISNFEAGASYTMFRHYSIGASAYALVPAGPQKVFSRFVAPDSAVSGDANHYRYWNNAFETIGNSTIARDNGYSGWVDVARIKHLRVEAGYTYSIHYALGSAYLMLRFDGTSLIRLLTMTQ